MSESLVSIGGGLIAEKNASAVLNYVLDYSGDLGTGETITGSIWTTPAAAGGITLFGNAFSDTQSMIVVSGGTAGQWYVFENVSTSSTGLTHSASISIFVTDLATIGAGIFTPFPSIAAAIASLRRDRLYALLTLYFPGMPLDDDYLAEQLIAATSYIEHRLRVFLTPTEVVPNTALQSEFDAFNNATPPVRYWTEPAYDYNPNFFQGDQFGRMETRQRPIISLHSMRFVYPTPNSTLYTIPSEWFRIDSKFGIVNLLPLQTTFALPLNAFILSALGGGQTIPAFIQVRYLAGLTNCAVQYPEILNCIKRQTVLQIYEQLFFPSNRSESTSADGLSQTVSLGIMVEKYSQGVETMIDKIAQSLFGIRSWVV